MPNRNYNPKVLSGAQVRLLDKLVPAPSRHGVYLGELLDRVAAGDNVAIGEKATQVSGAVHSTAFAYVPGTLQVYVDHLLTDTVDITETTPSTGVFTLNADPTPAGVWVIYSKAF